VGGCSSGLGGFGDWLNLGGGASGDLIDTAYYAHLSRILVDSGHVNAGEEIAKEGNTGHSTGPHLHFEVRIDGVPINPIPWLFKHGIRI